jgi:hypothetical protein
MRKAMTLLVPAAVALSGCVSGARETPVVVAPSPEAFRAPQVMRESGLESVIGEGAAALSRRFGEARIDLKEGDARKLQFVSRGCVLDIYLYPLASNSAPVATHVEARRRVGGGETDRADCIEEVERMARGG